MRELSDEDRLVFHDCFEKHLNWMIDDCEQYGKLDASSGEKIMNVMQGILLALRKLQYLTMDQYMHLSESVLHLHYAASNGEEYSKEYNFILDYFKPKSLTENNA